MRTPWPSAARAIPFLRPTPSARPVTVSRTFFTAARPRPVHARYFSANASSLRRPWTTTTASGARLPGRFRSLLRSRRAHGTKPDAPATGAAAEAPLSLSQRLKKLSREYGWSALGVYILLSAVDFPLCFLAVRMLGTERIGHWEHVVIEAVTSVVRTVVANPRKARETVEDVVAEGDIPGDATTREGAWGWQGNVDRARRENKEDKAAIWTQLALAYAMHKSLIFFRVPLTAAVTPKVVKTLRSWGWDIGKRRPKIPTEK